MGNNTAVDQKDVVVGGDFFSDGWPYYLPKVGEWRCGDSTRNIFHEDVVFVEKTVREMQVSCWRGHFEKKRMQGPGRPNSTEVDVARAWATLVFVDSHGNSMEVPNCQQLKDIGIYDNLCLHILEIKVLCCIFTCICTCYISKIYFYVFIYLLGLGEFLHETSIELASSESHGVGTKKRRFTLRS